ncbi:MAG: hypothetical protein NXY57DRAFT_873087, partial [Lentinula lateritia]
SYRHPEGVFVQTKIVALIADLQAIRKTGGFLSPTAEWLSIRTKSGRQDYASTTGVRWTALHRLPHWDPVKHLVLEFMHNWLEGVLAHQLRTLWGIGRDSKSAEVMAEALALLTKDEEYTDAELSESADELEELQAEMAQYNITLSQDSDHSVTLSGSSQSDDSTP